MTGDTDGFVADVMLGRLVTYTRMMGYDVVYALDEGSVDDDAVLGIAREEDRTVLTRDAELGSRADDAVVLDSRDIEGQLRELRDAGVELGLGEPARCSDCNGVLSETDAAASDIPDDVERAWRCEGCGKAYWKGSHWDDVRDTLSGL